MYLMIMDWNCTKMCYGMAVVCCPYWLDAPGLQCISMQQHCFRAVSRLMKAHQKALLLALQCIISTGLKTVFSSTACCLSNTTCIQQQVPKNAFPTQLFYCTLRPLGKVPLEDGAGGEVAANSRKSVFSDFYLWKLPANCKIFLHCSFCNDYCNWFCLLMITVMITECRVKHLNAIQQSKICLTASVAPETSGRVIFLPHKHHHLLWVSVNSHISYLSLCPLDICLQLACEQISLVAATTPAKLQNISVYFLLGL